MWYCTIYFLSKYRNNSPHPVVYFTYFQTTGEVQGGGGRGRREKKKSKTITGPPLSTGIRILLMRVIKILNNPTPHPSHKREDNYGYEYDDEYDDNNGYEYNNEYKNEYDKH